MKNVKIYSLSFQGRRENNQDSYLELTLDPDIVFLAIADGMGGVAGGKKASDTVIKCCERIVNATFGEKGTVDLKQALRKIFFEAQKTIKEEILKNPDLAGMGTTLACLLIKGDKFVWGNLGDSRIYHYSESKLKLITKDHTYIQEFIDENKGALTQSIIDKYSNFLTRSIDGGSDEPDIFPVAKDCNIIQDAEGFLLCSDGLIINKANSDFEFLEKIILRTKNLETAAERLKEFAYINGSSDNITVVLLEKGKLNRSKLPLTLPSPKQVAKKKKKYFSNHNRILGLIGFTAIAVLVAIVSIVYNKYYLGNSKVQNYTQYELHRQDPEKKISNITQSHDNKEMKEENEKQPDSFSLLNNRATTSKGDISLSKNQSKKNELAEIPNIIGQSEEKAIEYLRKKGFANIRTIIIGSEKKNIGKVIKMDPLPSVQVKKNTTINITIGS